MGPVIAMVVMLLAAAHPTPPPPKPAAPKGPTFLATGRRAMSTLLGVYYVNGTWRGCDAAGCPTADTDWGDDALTDTLALRWAQTGDPNLVPLLGALAANAPTYSAPCQDASSCSSLSDQPSWDAVALANEYLATRDPTTLAKAEAAYAFVANSTVYTVGSCPSIPYQKAGGGDTRVKTLETEATLVKAAILLYTATGNSNYLNSAIAGYNAARTYFLDPGVPLYTVYVFDDGGSCRQLPGRFFASVNGEMIWAGSKLYHYTANSAYLDQASATADAVVRYLSDKRGVFADLQAENDIVEPLVEGMYELARRHHHSASQWIEANAAAALSGRTRDGSFGRFFDGPPPRTTVTAWQTNGGLALQIAASALAPNKAVSGTHQWAKMRYFPQDISAPPAGLSFRGSGIAVLGTLGENCCTRGHARVFVDGHETFDQSGIWQNKSSVKMPIPDTVLFAWRWKKAGRHKLSFLPGIENPKEGGSFLHIVGYELLR